MAPFTRVRARVLFVACGLMILGPAAAPKAVAAQSGADLHTSVATSYVRSNHSAFIAPGRDHVAMVITIPLIATDTGASSRHTLRNALIGAAIGGTVLGSIAAVHAARCEDCFFQGPFVAIAVGAGAGLGGLIGSALSSD